MKKVISVVAVLVVLISCKPAKKENAQFKVVTTTTMLTDLLKVIGKDVVEVEGLMGTGVDPHLYKASEGDVGKLQSADLIIYNGLHLEGKLAEVFEKMEHSGVNTFAVGSVLSTQNIIHSEEFTSSIDPHIWFSIENWELIIGAVTQRLIKELPAKKEMILKNALTYGKQIKTLKTELTAKINELPNESRVLVTAHDAFSYFGKEFDFEVVGLQGLSTATEASVKDRQRLAKLIVSRKIKATFVESSVPKRTVEALQASVKALGYEVKIGGELFSDALGDPATVEGTYIGMYQHNVNTIVNALK